MHSNNAYPTAFENRKPMHGPTAGTSNPGATVAVKSDVIPSFTNGIDDSDSHLSPVIDDFDRPLHNYQHYQHTESQEETISQTHLNRRAGENQVFTSEAGRNHDSRDNLLLPHSHSPVNLNRGPVEDILDDFMPDVDQPGKPKQLLFEAPPSLKKKIKFPFGNGWMRRSLPTKQSEKGASDNHTNETVYPVLVQPSFQFKRHDTLPRQFAAPQNRHTNPGESVSSGLMIRPTIPSGPTGAGTFLPEDKERHDRIPVPSPSNTTTTVLNVSVGGGTQRNVETTETHNSTKSSKTRSHYTRDDRRRVGKYGSGPKQRSITGGTEQPNEHNHDASHGITSPSNSRPNPMQAPILPLEPTQTNVFETIHTVNTSKHSNHPPYRHTIPADSVHASSGSNAHHYTTIPPRTTPNPDSETAYNSLTRHKTTQSRPLRSVRSTPSSPVMGVRRQQQRLDSTSTNRNNIIESPLPIGLPPSSPHRKNFTRGQVRRDQQTGCILTPTGPPRQQVFNEMDPITGTPIQVITEAQSFTDLQQQVLFTETNEQIHGDHDTKYRVTQHTIRKKSASPNSHIRRFQTPTPEPTTPYRATSHTNISGRHHLDRPQWSSDMNLRTSTSYKQAPMMSTYSAHRENMQRRDEQQRNMGDGLSARYYEETRPSGGAEVLEEVETITLQPIGRGVHDLEPTGSIARSYRANTPTGNRGVPPGRSRSYASFSHDPQLLSLNRSTLHSRRARTASPLAYAAPLPHSWQSPYAENRQQVQYRQPSMVRVDNSFSNPYLETNRNRSSLYQHNRNSSLLSSNLHYSTPMEYATQQDYRSRASRSYGANYDQSDGFRTIATTNLHRDIHNSGAPSPYITPHQNTYFEGASTSEHRYRTEPWRAATVPPNYAGSTSGISVFGDGTESESALLKSVKETYRDWYLPEKTREQVKAMLRNREPGSFIIRSSVSCPNSFSMGVKAPLTPGQTLTSPDFLESGSVKNFMIGTVPMPDGRPNGVQLCGFHDPPIFPTLIAFVHHYCLHPAPLPCALRLPTGAHQRAMSVTHGSTVNRQMSLRMADMLYLGSVPVDRLEGPAAVRKAVSHLLSLHASTANKLPKRCEVILNVDPQTGIRFSDRVKPMQVDKLIKRSNLQFISFDPESRTYCDPDLLNRGMVAAKTFGIVVRKTKLFLHENVVYVFSELDPNHSALTLVNYIEQIFFAKNQI